MVNIRSGGAIATSLSAIALISSLAGAGLAATAPQFVGITAAVLNDVEIDRGAAPQHHRAALRERVALADRVRTGQQSQVQVLLLDKSVFTVGANARLTIDRYVYDPDGGRSFAASVTKGAFRFMSGRPDKAGSSSINTPVATIGIRGTILDGVIGPDAVNIVSGEQGIGRNVDSDPETATLVILRGPGLQRQGNATVGAITVTAGGKMVALDRPLLAAYVPYKGAVPIGPFTISLSGLARVQELIMPLLATRGAPVATTPQLPVYAPTRSRPPRRFLPFPGAGDQGGNAAIPRFDLPNFPQQPATDYPPPPRQSATTGQQSPPPTTAPGPNVP